MTTQRFGVSPGEAALAPRELESIDVSITYVGRVERAFATACTAAGHAFVCRSIREITQIFFWRQEPGLLG